jgi:hypothetical protein
MTWVGVAGVAGLRRSEGGIAGIVTDDGPWNVGETELESSQMMLPIEKKKQKSKRRK